MSPDERPTKQLSTLQRWYRAFDWKSRVAKQDAEIARAQFEEIKARSVESGFAHYPARVQALIELGDMLLEEIYEDDKRWLPDVKAVGAGESYERIDIVRFNSPLIEQFRKTLDDIAAELGERRKGIELTGKDGGPIETRDMDRVRKERWADFTEAIAVGMDSENVEDN